MKSKQSLPKPLSAFERIVKLLAFTSQDDRVALMKLMAADMGGERLFTATEVKQIVQQEVQAYVSRQQMNRTLSEVQRGFNDAIRHPR